MGYHSYQPRRGDSALARGIAPRAGCGQGLSALKGRFTSCSCVRSPLQGSVKFLEAAVIPGALPRA